MKGLLIFLLLIFFIESRVPNNTIVKSTNTRKPNKNSTQVSGSKLPITKPISKPTSKATTKMTSRTDSKPKTSKIQSKPTSKIISCTGGRVVSGICKCPNETKYYNGKCVKETPVKCLGGQISNNSCVCPQKTKLQNGICIGV